jgi:hypothetical protein
MESTCEASLEELKILLDHLAFEYVKTNDEHRRSEIATEISEILALAVKSRPSAA